MQPLPASGMAELLELGDFFVAESAWSGKAEAVEVPFGLLVLCSPLVPACVVGTVERILLSTVERLARVGRAAPRRIRLN